MSPATPARRLPEDFRPRADKQRGSAENPNIGLEATDAFVLGAGPNGLAAAIALQRAGLSVTVVERGETVGGSCRSGPLTLPGFVHDYCAAVMPLAAVSPFFRSLPLVEHGLSWVRSEACLAHPFDDGSAALLWPSVAQTAEDLGESGPYRRLMTELQRDALDLLKEILAPIHLSLPTPKLVRASFWASLPAEMTGRRLFKTERGASLFAGLAAHSMLPLDEPLSAAAGLILMLAAHAEGWPLPRGGAQAVSDALASYLRSIGGKVSLGTEVRSLKELPRSRVVLCDVTPRQFLRLAQNDLSPRYRRRLERFRYGMAVYKMDWALRGPIPWRSSECRRAATVHLGGTGEEIAASERAAWNRTEGPRPFTVVCQPSLVDPTRAPMGMQTAWAYCHTYADTSEAPAARIEAQLERFAPGFGDLVVGRSARGPRELERYNPNIVDGDIAGGTLDVRQTLFRPTHRWYRTSLDRVYLCSASTPPGGGVHGLPGYYAARAALADLG